MLDLTVSNPTECGFEYDSSTILNALSNPAVLSYEPNPRGLESARRAVAGYYADRKEDVSTEDIFLTTSTSEAYSYIFRTLCDPGDEVLLLWGCFLADYPTTRDVYFTVALLHVLAEVPFLLRAL